MRLSSVLPYQYQSLCETMIFGNFFYSVCCRPYIFFLYYVIKRVRAKPEVSWAILSTASSIINKFHIKNTFDFKGVAASQSGSTKCCHTRSGFNEKHSSRRNLERIHEQLNIYVYGIIVT